MVHPETARPAPPRTQAPPALHHNNFDLLRFFLAACVIVSHAYPLLLGNGTPEPLSRLTHGQLSLGGVGVNGFFVISGFLVTGSFVRSATGLDFLRKRVLRIFPGLAVALAVCVLVVAPLGGAAFPSYLHQRGTWEFLAILLMHDVGPIDTIPGVFGHIPFSDVIGPAYTLRYEFGCYLLVLALGLARVFRRPPAAALVVGALFAASLAAYHHWGGEFPHRLPWYGTLGNQFQFTTYFLAGSLAYLLREKIPHSRMIAALCVAVLLSCHSRHLSDVLPLAGTFLLLYFVFSKSVRFPHFGGKADLSYGLYLYGWPVEQLLVGHFGSHLTPLRLIAAALPISAALAWASWSFVERPCLRLKTRAPRRPAGGPGTAAQSQAL